MNCVTRICWRLIRGSCIRNWGPSKPRDWLPDTPRRWVYVRHTVGLADPLTAADVHVGERLDDGFPQTLEEYLRETGIRYLKIKLTSDLDQNLQRLTTIAALVQQLLWRGVFMLRWMATSSLDRPTNSAPRLTFSTRTH